MILIAGDSNSRNTFEQFKEKLITNVAEEIIFSFVTSNESLKTVLETQIDPAPRVIYLGSPLNEIALRLQKNKAKGRDETIKTVMEDYINVVNNNAGENTTVFHVLVPPFLRLDPKWFEEKVRLAHFSERKKAVCGSRKK